VKDDLCAGEELPLKPKTRLECACEVIFAFVRKEQIGKALVPYEWMM
jgi:hypothetical protein